MALWHVRPQPAWSVGRRVNADGSGGTLPTPGYSDFGVLRFSTDAAERSLRVDYVRSADEAVLDTFTVRRG